MRGGQALVVGLAAIAALCCSTGPEQALLTRFFAASRLRDLTALQKVATVVFEPKRDGVVIAFDIVAVNRSATPGEEEIAIVAPVRLPDGRTVEKQFVVAVRGGVITSINERPASPSAPRR